MLNLYESVRSNPSFNKLEIGDLLFAEYTCPVDEARLEQWSHSDYLVHVLSGRKIWHTSVEEIMEANFRFHLSLDEYAALCHRSLSSFKRDFRTHFGEPPGRWLLRRRLDYAAALLQTTTARITEIVFESGFEDVAHFSRVFKHRFRVAPSAYRHAVSAPA